jgi:hypothetical protein
MKKLAKATKAAVAKEAVPMKIRKETLNYDKRKLKIVVQLQSSVF